MPVRTILGGLAIALAVLVVVSWAVSTSRDFGWIHLVGLGVSAAILVMLFLGRAGGQPTRPPD